MSISAEKLKELGLTKVGDKLAKKQDMKKRAAIAYEFYRVASPEVLSGFSARMKERTIKITEPCPQCFGKGKENLFFAKSDKMVEGMNRLAKQSKIKAKNCNYCQHTGAKNQEYDRLRFTPIDQYDKIPPEPCLAQLERAHQRGCFDTFEVADVQTVQERPDPIIFGIIKGCPDKFFVTQWDTDIDINYILDEK